MEQKDRQAAPPCASHVGTQIPVPSRLRRLQRWWCILRYHKPSQLAHRLLKVAQNRIVRPRGEVGDPSQPAPVLRDNGGLRSWSEAKLAERRAQKAQEKSEHLLDRRFEFLGIEQQLGDPIDWSLSDRPQLAHLWRFHLHYQEYLLDLLAAGIDSGQSQPIEHAWQLVREWLAGNTSAASGGLQDAWHPFCISRRIPVWIALWQLAPPTESLAAEVLRSIRTQTGFLRRHLERDLGGNHLLENAKALAIAGAFLTGPEADGWLQTSDKLLARELPHQLLPHGEHFERSAMYHAQMLSAVLDVRDAVEQVAPELAARCGAAAGRMANFLSEIRHPDGDIPLFGDSCFEEAPPLDQLLKRAAGPGHSAEQVEIRKDNSSRVLGDYWAWRQRGDFFLLDAGPVAPDYLPAHGHSDLLTFEASIAGQRVFVDSGVYNYAADAMRHYCRSTAAHNVVQINGEEQCDIWSRFRMGRRGWPAPLSTGQFDGFQWAAASHNAYRHLGARVARWVACHARGPWLIVDGVDGSGECQLQNRLHLHPDVEVWQEDVALVCLVIGKEKFHLRPLAPGKLTVAEGWYCPHFGCRIANRVLEWSTTVPLPAVSGWSLVSADRATGRGDLKISGSLASVSLAWVEANKTTNFAGVFTCLR